MERNTVLSGLSLGVKGAARLIHTRVLCVADFLIKILFSNTFLPPCACPSFPPDSSRERNGRSRNRLMPKISAFELVSKTGQFLTLIKIMQNPLF